MVAFEAPDGSWLSVDHKTGSIHTGLRNRGGQYVFKLVNLRNPRAAGPIRFGDECWVSEVTHVCIACDYGGVMLPRLSSGCVRFCSCVFAKEL